MLLFLMHFRQIFRQFHVHLRHYILMVLNARIYLRLQATVWNYIIIFNFQPVMRHHVLMSDVQYGRFYLFELTTGDRGQCGNQRRETEGYTQRYQ